MIEGVIGNKVIGSEKNVPDESSLENYKDKDSDLEEEGQNEENEL